jgi:hypothetical protein
MKPRPRQLTLGPRTWGGARDGAGRKPKSGRRNVPHVRRTPHESRCPAHVTLRGGRRSLPQERTILMSNPERATRGNDAALPRSGVQHQKDHLHLWVEANAPTGFERGVRGLAIRIARLVNRMCGRRGAVWADRYHARLLRTPREVRNALVYVLNNFRKHVRGARGLDPYSSARWFTGSASPPCPVAEPVVARARTWLALVGWRRAGLIEVNESPRAG